MKLHVDDDKYEFQMTVNSKYNNYTRNIDSF